MRGRASSPAALRQAHDRTAPYWAVALVVLCCTGLATGWIDGGRLWSGYVLDATGPAWTYILLRLRFTRWVDNAWTRLFSPARAFVVCAGACWIVEVLQFLDVYDATFDPWDLIAYLVILVPLAIVDHQTEGAAARPGPHRPAPPDPLDRKR